MRNGLAQAKSGHFAKVTWYSAVGSGSLRKRMGCQKALQGHEEIHSTVGERLPPLQGKDLFMDGLIGDMKHCRTAK